MKRLAIIFTTAALAASPALAKPGEQGKGHDKAAAKAAKAHGKGHGAATVYRPAGASDSAFHVHQKLFNPGQRLPAAYYAQNRTYVIADPDQYHLRAAPAGYEWVRSTATSIWCAPARA